MDSLTLKDNGSSHSSTITELARFLLSTGPHDIHLIGVAGSGMSGLAALLLSLGHRVSGSDKVTTHEIDRLSRCGLIFNTPHQQGEMDHAALIIYSSAIGPGNSAFEEARSLEKPMARRAEVLAALMLDKKGIIVCGMHGKTTTTTMAAYVFGEAGLSPSHYVGAEVPILGTNARWSPEGDYFIAEGDESDGTLVNYIAEHALVLNIEPEHLDFYKSSDAIDAVFQRLIQQTRGSLFYWADDLGAARLSAHHPRAVAVGTGEGSDYRYVSLKKEREGSSFEVVARGRNVGRVFLSIPGTHNVNNAMLVIALALELKIPFETVGAALHRFCGAKRRFELKYQGGGIRVFDDYGHHPTEIAATLSTARSLLNDTPESTPGRLLVMFQPHRYSRTVAFQHEFGKALLAADTVFVTDIYPANERPMPGVSGKMLVDTAQAQGHRSIFFESPLEGLRYKLGAMVRSGDLVLSLGAGNIHEEATRLVEDLMIRDRLLAAMGQGTIELYEPLSRHTTMRVGGPAQFWAEPETEEGFAQLVKKCFEEKIPLMVMGRGSNLIVRDAGIAGVVVHLARGCFVECRVEDRSITAGVGVKFKQLSSLARQAGLTGFEWMDGIPGNLGGGLRMNAGSMGRQTFEQVVKIDYVDIKGARGTATPQELEIFYRDVPFLKNHYVLSATLQGDTGSVEVIDRLIQSSWQHRRQTQPIAASAGCIFKNPSAAMPAGRLVEELGLKNYSIGKARVSEIHGNFIVNDGGATAAEVLALIQNIQERAWKERGIRLETEVQIVGGDY
jgi:UDP-N-acetylmuramate--L-alanine ligase/UDP-N-acetylenolpyruvoylglucosamine reductase